MNDPANARSGNEPLAIRRVKEISKDWLTKKLVFLVKHGEIMGTFTINYLESLCGIAQ